jgi:hypothetical protein
MNDPNRPRLDEILGGGLADFNAKWATTTSAGSHRVLPAGQYTGLVVDGRLAETKAKRTPSYRLTIEVTQPKEFEGCRVYHDLWLSDKALPFAKRDLEKLGITAIEQLERPPATGLVIDFKLVLNTSDDGSEFNKVEKFDVRARRTSHSKPIRFSRCGQSLEPTGRRRL